MKTSFLIFGLLFSAIAYSQETCKARITEPSDKYQLQAQFTCKPENFSFTLQDKFGTEIFRSDNPDFIWDQKTKDGTIAENGIYNYTLKCRFDDEAIKLTGQVTLKHWLWLK